MMSKLSENFYLNEMLWSETAARLGRKVEANDRIVEALKWGCVEVMQPIRDALCAHYGRDMPISISSGYRPSWLNKAIGGSMKSDHMRGYAFDFDTPSITPFELAAFIASKIDQWPIDKLILEFGAWVHISVTPPNQAPMRKIMTAAKIKDPKTAETKTTYYQGLRQ